MPQYQELQQTGYRQFMLHDQKYKQTKNTQKLRRA
jgi:hypothetical protein